MNMNRLGNARNPYQGPYKRVLAVCSAGLLRSPTIAWVLSNDPYNYNTRSAGVSSEYGLVPVDEALLYWADEVVCAEQSHAAKIQKMLENRIFVIPPSVVTLNIPDNFEYRDENLVNTIKTKYDEYLNRSK